MAFRLSTRLTAFFLASAMVLGVTAPTWAEASDLRVAAVEIKGNKSVPTDKILALLKTKTGEVIPKDKIEARLRDEDLKAINGSGLFADHVVRFAPDGDGIKVTYEVVENPKLAGFEFKGNTMVPSKELYPLLRSKVGEVLNTKLLQEDLDRIVKYYAVKGGMARVADIQVDPSAKLITTIAESKISKIVITGNTKTKDRVIRRELSSHEGDLVDFNKIRSEQRRILNLGYFDTITPKLEPGTGKDDIVYTIDLAERKKLGLASGGLGYSAVDGIMGYLDVRDENLFGNGQNLSLKTELGSKGTKTYELSFLEPWLDAKRTSLGLSLYNREESRNEVLLGDVSSTAYTERRVGGDLTVGRPLDLDSRLTLKLKTENTSTFTQGGSSVTIPGNGITRSATVGLDRDTRDNFMNPSTGYRLSATAEGAGGILGGDNNFVKLQAEGSTYMNGFKSNTVAVRISGGQVLHSGALPAQESFRLGGADTIRGYDYGAMQGDTMVNANVEYRFPIAKVVSGAAFVDAGDAWMAQAGSKGLKVGGGLGVRLDTPLGLLRLDYGLAKDKDGKIKGKTYFSFGQTF